MAFPPFLASMDWYSSQRTTDTITIACVTLICLEVFPLFARTSSSLWTRVIRRIARNDPAPEPVNQDVAPAPEVPAEQQLPVTQETPADQEEPGAPEILVDQQVPATQGVVHHQTRPKRSMTHRQLLQTMTEPTRSKHALFMGHDRRQLIIPKDSIVDVKEVRVVST